MPMVNFNFKVEKWLKFIVQNVSIVSMNGLARMVMELQINVQNAIALKLPVLPSLHKGFMS